jgi:hypothetical protein
MAAAGAPAVDVLTAASMSVSVQKVAIGKLGTAIKTLIGKFEKQIAAENANLDSARVFGLNGYNVWENEKLSEKFHLTGLIDPSVMEEHFKYAIIYTGIPGSGGKSDRLADVEAAFAQTQKYPIIFKLDLASMYIKLMDEKSTDIFPTLNLENKELWNAIQNLFPTMFKLLQLLLQAVIPPFETSADRVKVERAVSNYLQPYHLSMKTIVNVVDNTLFPLFKRWKPDFKAPAHHGGSA